MRATASLLACWGLRLSLLTLRCLAALLISLLPVSVVSLPLTTAWKDKKHHCDDDAVKSFSVCTPFYASPTDVATNAFGIKIFRCTEDLADVRTRATWREGGEGRVLHACLPSPWVHCG